MSSTQFESVLQENRKFLPSEDFVNQAHVSGTSDYQSRYRHSIEHNEEFWAKSAEGLHWFKKWDRVLDASQKPFFKWFVGGKLNLCYNCVDRHVLEGRGNQVAFHFEGEPGDSNTLSYRQVLREVSILANTLKSLGVAKGDRVALYMPMVVELPLAVLACARIGAVHTVIFGGFSSEAIRDRVNDCGAKVVITSDGGWRRGKPLELKNIVDEGVAACPSVEKVLVFQRHPGKPPFNCSMKPGRDVWYHDASKGQSASCPCEEMDAEDMLFLLYTSGTTGKPKGIIHTTGGYGVFAQITSLLTFDMKATDVYWCTADVGWITGHSYIVYGPMANGVAQVIYEGAPDFPDYGRFWAIVEKYGVSIFYTAPTAIRAFMKWGEQWPKGRDLSSLRLLGTVGESINPEAWMWYHSVIGGERCPIVDTWWQTETGGHMLTPLPGVTATKPGCATTPFFGIDAVIIDNDGNECEAGILAIRQPWPGMLRGIYGDNDRYVQTYWSRWDGKYYFPGDGARRDEDGYIWILGRVDDVVNVSGHRIGTAELESAFIEHQSVAESAVIGVKHEIKGEGLVGFVTLKHGQTGSDQLRKELVALIDQKIGKFARPERIVFTSDLPKTRSGKIMRRLLRDIAEGRDLGNTTTLADPGVVTSLQREFAAK